MLRSKFAVSGSHRRGERREDRKDRPVFRAGVRFLQLGGFAFCLNIAITTTLHELMGLPADLAFAVALLTLFFVNFFGFRRYVYRSTGHARGQIGRYFIAVVCFRLAEYGGFLLLHKQIGIDYLPTAMAVLAISAVAKFLTFRNWVFTG